MRASESMMLALPSEPELAIDARPIPPAMIFCCSAASSAGGLVAMNSEDSTEADATEEDGERWSECGDSDAEDWTSSSSSSEHDHEPPARSARADAAPAAARYDALSWFERITLGEPRWSSASRGAEPPGKEGASWWSLAMGGARPAASEEGPSGSPQQHVCATCGYCADQQVFFLRDRAFCSSSCVEQHARDMDELRLLRSRKRARN